MLTLYNVVSSDGFIAQEDGGEEFIPDEVWSDFLEICNEYDTLIMGKNTYAAIQSFGKELVEPFEKSDIKKVVVTQDEDFTPKVAYKKASSIHDALEMGSDILLSSGPSLNSAFLRERLIDHIILNKLPVAIGAGIRQFETDTIPSYQLLLLRKLTREKGDRRKLEFYKVDYKH